MQENFRLGCELIEEGEYPRAHVILVQALEDATTLEDSLSMGQILSRDGFILHKSGNVKEALAAYQKAFDIFHQAGNDQQFRQAALDGLGPRIRSNAVFRPGGLPMQDGLCRQ